MIDKASLFPLLLSTIAGLSTVLGAVIIFFSKTRNEKFLTFSLGFSAGVMITVSFTDLFPTAQEAISKYHGKVNGILWSILFLLIGKGTEKEKIKRMINENHLNNVRFIDFVPLNEYKSLLQLCHIGLISLNDKFTVPNTPYKMCDYFDAGLPVLASIDTNNDLHMVQNHSQKNWNI